MHCIAQQAKDGINLGAMGLDAGAKRDDGANVRPNGLGKGRSSKDSAIFKAALRHIFVDSCLLKGSRSSALDTGLMDVVDDESGPSDIDPVEEPMEHKG